MILVRHHLAIAAWLLTINACSEAEAPCTAIGYSPGRITVVDSSGGLVVDAQVTLRIDGGPERQAACSKRREAGGCEAWALGPIGSNAIRATRADGTSAAERTVVVRDVGTATCEVPVYEDVELVLTD